MKKIGKNVTIEEEPTSSRRGRERGSVKKIQVEKEENKGYELFIQCETISRSKENSTWSWHEEFMLEWCKTFIGKKSPKKGIPKVNITTQ